MKINKPIQTKLESFNNLSKLYREGNITQKDIDRHNKIFKDNWVLKEGYLWKSTNFSTTINFNN